MASLIQNSGDCLSSGLSMGTPVVCSPPAAAAAAASYFADGDSDDAESLLLLADEELALSALAAGLLLDLDEEPGLTCFGFPVTVGTT